MNKLIIIAILVILALVLGVVLVWPKYQHWQNLKTIVEQKEDELESRENYFAQVRETFVKLEEYEDALTKISNALPDRPSLPTFFNLLYDLASQTGLILEELNPGTATPSEESNLQEISASLQLAGSYSAFKDFLRSLELSSRIIEVESISFQSPEDLEKPFSFNVVVKTYSY